MYNRGRSQYNPEWDLQLLVRLSDMGLDPAEIEQMLLSPRTFFWTSWIEPAASGNTESRKAVGITPSGDAVVVSLKIPPSGRLHIKDVNRIEEQTVHEVEKLER